MWPISTLPPSESQALALAQRQKSVEALPSLPSWKQDSLFCFEGHRVLWQHIGKSVWNAEQSLPPSDPSEEAFWMLTSGLGERLEFWHPESARHHLWPGISHPLPSRSCVKTHPSIPSLLPGRDEVPVTVAIGHSSAFSLWPHSGTLPMSTDLPHCPSATLSLLTLLCWMTQLWTERGTAGNSLPSSCPTLPFPGQTLNLGAWINAKLRAFSSNSLLSLHIERPSLDPSLA